MFTGQINSFEGLLASVPQGPSLTTESYSEKVEQLVSHFFVPDRESITPKGKLTNLKNNFEAIP